MKQVVAIVKPFLAERVLEAIAELGVNALAVHEVKGYGRQKSYLDATTEQDRSLAVLPKVEIQCWVEDSQIDHFVETVSQVARTGRMGDGKLFIIPHLDTVLNWMQIPTMFNYLPCFLSPHIFVSALVVF